MKTLIVFSVFLFSMHAFAVGGGTVGNGGDQLAIDFLNTAKDVLSTLKSNSTASAIDLKAFQDAIDRATIESTDDKLILNGFAKDAINYPDSMRIVFTRNSWREIQHTPTAALFALHEFLGLMRKDDSRYDISSKAISSVFGGTLTCTFSLQNNDYKTAVSHSMVIKIEKEMTAIHWQDDLNIYTVDFNPYAPSRIRIFLSLISLNDNARVFNYAATVPVSDPFFYMDYEVADSRYKIATVTCQ